jgi:hypothetical protein
MAEACFCIIYQLHIWEAGDSAVRKYGHVYPACKEGAQGVLFTFSFTDRASWEDLPALIQRTRLPQDSLTPVGARYPSPTNYLPYSSHIVAVCRCSKAILSLHVAHPPPPPKHVGTKCKMASDTGSSKKYKMIKSYMYLVFAFLKNKIQCEVTV